MNNKEKLIQKCKAHDIDHSVFFKIKNRHSLADMKSKACMLSKKMYGIFDVDSVNISEDDHLGIKCEEERHCVSDLLLLENIKGGRYGYESKIKEIAA